LLTRARSVCRWRTHQSYWPDGIYTAPGEAALVYDVSVLKDYGMNLIRLHQKANPERWYHAADR
jgi:hypothetical protein